MSKEEFMKQVIPPSDYEFIRQTAVDYSLTWQEVYEVFIQHRDMAGFYMKLESLLASKRDH